MARSTHHQWYSRTKLGAMLSRSVSMPTRARHATQPVVHTNPKRKRGQTLSRACPSLALLFFVPRWRVGLVLHFFCNGPYGTAIETVGAVGAVPIVPPDHRVARHRYLDNGGQLAGFPAI